MSSYQSFESPRFKVTPSKVLWMYPQVWTPGTSWGTGWLSRPPGRQRPTTFQRFVKRFRSFLTIPYSSVCDLNSSILLKKIGMNDYFKMIHSYVFMCFFVSRLYQFLPSCMTWFYVVYFPLLTTRWCCYMMFLGNPFIAQDAAEETGYAARPPLWGRRLKVSCSSWLEEHLSLFQTHRSVCMKLQEILFLKMSADLKLKGQSHLRTHHSLPFISSWSEIRRTWIFSSVTSPG